MLDSRIKQLFELGTEKPNIGTHGKQRHVVSLRSMSREFMADIFSEEHINHPIETIQADNFRIQNIV